MRSTDLVLLGAVAVFVAGVPPAGGVAPGQTKAPPRLPASAAPSAESRGPGQLGTGMQANWVRPSRAAILEMLERQVPGSTKVEKARVRNPLPARNGADPEQLEAQRVTAPGTLYRAPTRKELLERIKAFPGGKEMLDDAQRNGAHISGLRPAEDPGAWMDWFRVPSAWAQTGFDVSLTPASPVSSGGANRLGFECVTILGGVGPIIRSGGMTNFLVLAPTGGYFVIYLAGRIAPGTSVVLDHVKTYIPRVATQLHAWPPGKTFTEAVFPTVVELAPGSHTFEFRCISGSMSVNEARMYSL